MKNEPVLKLAISIHENHGVYALLIGSGVSRAAGIPTGWEVVQDLISKVAVMEKAEPQPNLEAWYQQNFGEVPDYDKLLDRLTTTSAERMALLRSYFEPTEEEREQGLKIPTSAHKAIAKLTKLGYIRIILTTNFDRLIERALEEEGVVPDVISSDDGLKGAIPYVHSRCLVVKLNGDYRDTRIKNTHEELANYSQELNNFLDRIFDEFGLIVCGWSSGWDVALRNAILRTPTRRFTTFWLAKGELIEDAKNIIQQRRAEVIPIESANQIFTELIEKVESLRELKLSTPISTAVAVATVKRYLAEPQHRIRLHDLIQEETERVYRELSSKRFETQINNLTKELFQKRMHEYETLIERLMAMLAALSYHDAGDNANLLTQCIELLMQVPRKEGKNVLIDLQYYPALLLVYAAGINALASRRLHNLGAILKKPIYRDYNFNVRTSSIEKLHVLSVFTHGASKWVPRQNAENEYTPANNYLCEILRPVLHDYLPDSTIFEEIFDIFEYLLALTYLDFVDKFLFSWDEVPGDDSDRFIEFLRQRYSVIGVEKEKIKKIDKMTINISTEKNHIWLKLNDEKTNATLTIDDGRTDEFLVSIENGEINLYLDEKWSPVGRFGWRYSRFERRWKHSPLAEFIRSGLDRGSDWELLKAGFFNGSIERFMKVVEIHKKLLQNQTKGWI